MGLFRKRPVVVEAKQLTFATLDEVTYWCGGNVQQQPKPSDVNDVWTFINIPTLEGIMRGDMGDYIIKGVQGEFYPCKPDIFEATYEAV